MTEHTVNSDRWTRIHIYKHWNFEPVEGHIAHICRDAKQLWQVKHTESYIIYCYWHEQTPTNVMYISKWHFKYANFRPNTVVFVHLNIKKRNMILNLKFQFDTSYNHVVNLYHLDVHTHIHHLILKCSTVSIVYAIQL